MRSNKGELIEFAWRYNKTRADTHTHTRRCRVGEKKKSKVCLMHEVSLPESCRPAGGIRDKRFTLSSIISCCHRGSRDLGRRQPSRLILASHNTTVIAVRSERATDCDDGVYVRAHCSTGQWSPQEQCLITPSLSFCRNFNNEIVIECELRLPRLVCAEQLSAGSVFLQAFLKHITPDKHLTPGRRTNLS